MVNMKDLIGSVSASAAHAHRWDSERATQSLTDTRSRRPLNQRKNHAVATSQVCSNLFNHDQHPQPGPAGQPLRQQPVLPGVRR